MCGICGVIDYNKSSNLEESLLRRMCRELRHRGPDDEGIFIAQDDPSVGLGHRRLSVIDLSSQAKQPMHNEDGTLWLVFNGEIYNYRQLRHELEKRGHRFISQSDAETVIHLYEDFAENCLAYLHGMFAFAIWDKKQNKLFLARDRIGKKPFLYYYENGRFCFASEFSALLASGLVDKEINYNAIDQYLSLGYVPAPETIYKKVFKILPAHYGVLQDNQFKIKKYWELQYSPKIIISENEAASELLIVLREAVKLRLISDVPLGAFLSGGIDSSAIVALMSEISGKRIKTFSIGFREKDYNELRYAKNIAKRFNTEHYEFMVKPNAMEILPLLVERYGEPYADSSCIPTYYVAQQTRQYVTVALNGDGGDESFAGYERYQAMKMAQNYHRLPLFLREGLRRPLVRFLPDSPNFKNKRRRIRRLLENISLPFYARYARWVSMIDDQEKNRLYRDDFKSKLNNPGPVDWLRDYPGLGDNMELVDCLMAIDIKTNLANDLLVKMDIASMVNSLEARAPFLDQKVMEFAARLPGNLKLKGLVKKYILKKAVKDLIPPENIHRSKMGFGVPVGNWFRDELKGFLSDTLLSTSALKRGYFDPAAVKNIINEHISGKKDYAFQLWTLLMLELWHKRFID